MDCTAAGPNGRERSLIMLLTPRHQAAQELHVLFASAENRKNVCATRRPVASCEGAKRFKASIPI
jgi:hypothetical protein